MLLIHVLCGLFINVCMCVVCTRLIQWNGAEMKKKKTNISRLLIFLALFSAMQNLSHSANGVRITIHSSLYT